MCFDWRCSRRATPAIYAINDEYRRIAQEERKVHFVDCHDLFVEFREAEPGDSSDGTRRQVRYIWLSFCESIQESENHSELHSDLTAMPNIERRIKSIVCCAYAI
jgi:hypothetical protein